VVRKYLVFYLDFNEFREMIKFGYPLSISTVSKNFLEISDRYILSGLTNMAVVGCYDLGYKFAKLVKNIMINSFHISLKPILWEKVKDNNFSEFHTKVITYYSILITWIALFLTIFAKEIIYGFSKNSDYFSAYKIIGLVTFAISIKGLFPLFRIIFEIKQKTKYIPFIVTFAGILNIILNIILIPKFEMMGAAYSLFISYLLIIIFSFYFSNKLMHIKIEFRKIVSIVLSSICLIIFAKIIFDFPFIYRIFLKIIFIVSYPILLYLLKVFDRKEIAIIKDVLKNTKL